MVVATNVRSIQIFSVITVVNMFVQIIESIEIKKQCSVKNASTKENRQCTLKEHLVIMRLQSLGQQVKDTETNLMGLHQMEKKEK